MNNVAFSIRHSIRQIFRFLVPTNRPTPPPPSQARITYYRSPR